MKMPAHLVLNYVNRKPEEVKQCQLFLAEGNYNELQSIGHRLKGSGTTFGFPAVTEFGAAIERLSKDKNKNELKMVLDSFNQWVVNNCNRP